ncbi:MAG: SEFIR domain-containing protein [Dongiaceae bacterium]|jgi:hypothetical protein
MIAPKLFVSYSWTTPDYEARVLELATQLVESGVDVIIDKWNLKEGHDADKFMERMVTDSEIKKVILVCDKAYADKADRRAGGVGTEAQIISRKIYEQQDENKFVAVVMERDEGGKAYLPAYYKSRVYIDYTDPAKIAENFEQLIRWIYDKPLHVRPPLGKKPGFLEDNAGPALATSVSHRRAVDAVRNHRDHAVPAVTEYFALFASEMEKLRLEFKVEPFDDAVVESIESFTPYRNEVVELYIALAMYGDTLETRTALHRFFEQLIPYLDRPEGARSWHNWGFDNFRFVVHELFLYGLACLIRHERFDSAAYLMANEYYVAGRSEYGRDAMVQFDVFQNHIDSLDVRNKRLDLRRLSLQADLLHQRCKGVGLEFRHIMQADFVLFLRSHLHHQAWNWWPETLLYADRHSAAFEVFARSRSASFFDRSKVLLGVESKEALSPLMDGFAAHRERVPRWQFDTFNPARLLGFDELATKP